MRTVNAVRNKPQRIYFLGAACALLVVLIFRRHLSAEFVISKGFGIFSVPAPIPILAADWFKLIAHDPLTGLLLLDFFDLINYLLVGFVFYALFLHLQQNDRTLPGFALGCGLFGIVVYLLSNPAVRMFTLSQRFSAVNEIQKLEIIQIGDVILQSGLLEFGVNLGLFLVLASGLIFSLMMHKDNSFGKATSVFGLFANGIGLLYFPFLFLAPKLI